MAGTDGVKRAIRIDAGTLRAPVELPSGFLRVDGYAGRTGIYEYLNTDEDVKQDSSLKLGALRRELRPLESVSDPAALAAFEGVSITDGHTKKPVTPQTAKSVEVGSGTSAHMDGEQVAVSMVIKDPKTIAVVKSRKKNQLSPGYEVDLEKSPGSDARYGYPGNPQGRYDFIQRNIVPNHLALVERARGGAGMKLRMDAAASYRLDGLDAAANVAPIELDDQEDVIEAMEQFGRPEFSDPEDQAAAYAAICAAAKKYEVDSTAFEKAYGGQTQGADQMTTRNDEAFRSLEAQLINAKKELSEVTTERDSHKLRADSAEGELAEVKKEIPVLKAELAQVRIAAETVEITKQRTRADAAEEKLVLIATNRNDEIRARVLLERQCAPTLGPSFRMDNVDDHALRCMTLKKLAADADVSDAVEKGEIIGRFKAAVERRDENARSLAQVGMVMDASKAADAEAAAKKTNSDAWKKPLPNSLK